MASSHRHPRRHLYQKADRPYQRQPALSSQPSATFHPREEAGDFQGLFPLPANIEAILKSARLRVGPDFGDRRTFLVRNDSVLEALFSGEMKQCSICGLRVEDYASHLDDHFRENR